MNAQQNAWYRVPEVWLILVLLGATMAGSLALVAMAYRHPDTLQITPRSIASPLPPSSPARPTDDATP
jgi:hypothetical protein